MIETLLTLYREKFKFSKFYENLLYNISRNPNDYISSTALLSGYSTKTKVDQDIPIIKTQNGDTRVDLPIWFGVPESNNKIVIIGLEPRDTDKSGRLNIERVGNYVFGTPFALERPHGHYFSAFRELINTDGFFIYFTDVVKTYEVNDVENKAHDDKYARQTFSNKAEKGKALLLEELEIINPNKIVALGNDSFNFLKSFLGDRFQIQKVRHPSQGGSNIAREQLKSIIN